MAVADRADGGKMMPLSKQDKMRVVTAIRAVESRSTAEIRVHVRHLCLGDPLKAAQRVFKTLGMHRTRGRNAVLIFVATASHKLAVVGDQAIHEAAGARLWEDAAQEMKKKFSESQRGEAIVGAVERIGLELARFFPADGTHSNELPDTISEGQ